MNFQVMLKLIISAALIVVTTAANISAGPQIEMPESVFNFGIIPQHRIATHDFWIKSTGDEPLRITKIVPGCACTSIPLTDSVIAPGDSVALHIIFRSARYRGRVSKKPHLFTNASADKIELIIIAEVTPENVPVGPLAIYPELLDVSQFGRKLRRLARFELENRTDQELTITIVDSANKSIDVNLPEKIAPGQRAEGRVRVHEDMYQSAFEESITIQVNDPARTIYTLPFRRLYHPEKEAAEVDPN